MKKNPFNLILVVIGITLLTACASNSEKSVGSYTGLFNNQGDTETVVVTAGSSSNMVNMSDSEGWFSTQLVDVNLSVSGEVIAFAYTSNSTEDGDIISLSGSLTEDVLSLSFIWNYYYPGTNSATFVGTKQ